MKIEDLLSLAITPKPPEAKPTGEANFAQQLKEAIAADTSGAAAPQAISSLPQLAAIDPLTEVNRTPTEALDMVLSRLDNYREALAQPNMTLKDISTMVQTLEGDSQRLQSLAQPNMTLKDISTLVQTLEGDSQRLQSLAQSLPDSSPLKPVMEEAAALAYTESFKFNRGDYV